VPEKFNGRGGRISAAREKNKIKKQENFRCRKTCREFYFATRKTNSRHNASYSLFRVNSCDSCHSWPVSPFSSLCLCAFVPLCEKLSSPISVSLVPISGFSCSPVTMTTTATLTTTTTGWLVKTKRNRGFALQGCCASVSCAAKPLWSATPPRRFPAPLARRRVALPRNLVFRTDRSPSLLLRPPPQPVGRQTLLARMPRRSGRDIADWYARFRIGAASHPKWRAARPRELLQVALYYFNLPPLPSCLFSHREVC
jgi:hypothetical protein